MVKEGGSGQGRGEWSRMAGEGGGGGVSPPDAVKEIVLLQISGPSNRNPGRGRACCKIKKVHIKT